MSQVIKEVPLDTPDIEESALDIPEIETDIREIESDIPQELPAISETNDPPQKAKAKGRPKGSRNVAPSKPRPKKVTFEEKPIEAKAYSPSSPKRNLPIPEFGVNEVAVEMLKLLGNQKHIRQQRKSALYQSWFV